MLGIQSETRITTETNGRLITRAPAGANAASAATRFSRRILELDGLRGVAIALVLAFHVPALPLRAHSFWSFLPVIQRLGWSGVDLFFVLSGFLIGGILLDARESANYFRVFYGRRFFRIIPLYLLLLLVIWATWLIWPSAKVLGIGREGITLLPWMSYALLLQNFAMALKGTAGIIPLGVTWSLAVEEQFYLTLPLLIRVLSKRLLILLAVSGIAMAPVLRAFCYYQSPENHFSWFTLLPCRGDALLLGVLAALTVRDAGCVRYLQSHRRSLLLLLLIGSIGVTGLAIWAYDFRTSFAMLTAGMSILAIFYALVLVYVMLFPAGWLGAGLRWAPLCALGTVAYGVYLFHTVILLFFFNRFLKHRVPSLHSLHDLVIILSAFGAVFVFCAVSWHFFEKPLLKIGQRWKYQDRTLAQSPERKQREKDFYDHLVAEGSKTRSLLDRFSVAFYDKGHRGRLWSPVWQKIDLKDRVVLDYGCGIGDFSVRLAQMGARVTGIDISPNLIENARAAAANACLNGNSPQFVVGDAHRTPFGNDSFDYVMGNGALHHLDLDRAYAEIARVLKPGGKAIFMEPLYNHPLLWLLRRMTSSIHTADERPLSFKDMERCKSYFRVCVHQEHFLLAVCAAPAHLFGKEFALSVIGGLDRVDALLMSIVPVLRRFAWYTVMIMEK